MNTKKNKLIFAALTLLFGVGLFANITSPPSVEAVTDCDYSFEFGDYKVGAQQELVSEEDYRLFINTSCDDRTYVIFPDGSGDGWVFRENPQGMGVQIVVFAEEFESGNNTVQATYGGSPRSDGDEATITISNADVAREALNFDILDPDGPSVGDRPDAPTEEFFDGVENEPPSCESGLGILGWIVCPLINFLSFGLEQLDDIIGNLLSVRPEYYDNDEIRSAWRNIRNIAYMLLVPAMLVMVIGTALGFEFVSAYTVKKALPRMIAAAIFIAFSYEITVFLIQVINAIGLGIKGLMLAPFDNIPDTLAGYFTLGEGFATGVVLGIAGGIGIAVATGPGAIGIGALFLGFLAIAALVLVIAYAVLVLRQMIIIALMLLAPLAIIGWIFPSNTRLWTLWRGTFVKLLLMYPLIMLVLASGRILAHITNSMDPVGGVVESGANQLISPFMVLLAYTLPYLFVPFAFKFVGGTIGRLAGMATSMEGGWLKRISGKSREVREQYKAGDKNWKGFKRSSKASRRYDQKYNGNDSPSLMPDVSAIKRGENPFRQTIDGAKQRAEGAEQRRTDFKEARAAYFESQAKQNDPRTLSGKWREEASSAQTSAAATEAANKIADTIQDVLQNERDENGNRYDGSRAREIALDRLEEYATEKIDNGSMSQAEYNGISMAFAMQQAGEKLMNMQDHIAGMDPNSTQGQNAMQLYSGMLGNSSVYGAVTGQNAGLKAGIQQGAGEGAMREARAKVNFKEPPSKLAGMSKEAWQEMFRIDKNAAKQAYDNVAAIGGEPAAKLKISQEQAQQYAVSPPPPKPTQQMIQQSVQQQAARQQQPPQAPPPPPPPPQAPTPPTTGP